MKTIILEIRFVLIILDKMEKLCKVPEFRFKAKNMDDAIYDTFGTKCCKYEDEIYTVKCSEQFFIKWVIGICRFC